MIKRMMSSERSVSRTIELLRRAQAVCFDVDSTVITEEGIDVLADVCGAGKAVSEWTTKVRYVIICR
jgi:phosphoserine phosphatase